MEATLTRPVALPECPRCESTELTLCGANTYPYQPERRKLYVYQCGCGLAFTSYDAPLSPSSSASRF